MTTNTRNTLIALVCIVLVILLATFAWQQGWMPTIQPVATTTAPSVTGSTSTTPITSDITHSDGTITFGVPSGFGLAVNQSQVLVTSNIPPCEQGFDYCIYSLGDAYKGTNFQSAGVRLQKRQDLKTETSCLQTPPSGYDASVAPDVTHSVDAYSSSVFSNISDAAMGSYSKGAMYRLYVKGNSSCYEFETRIGQSQYQNYPAGSIKEFTAMDELNLETAMKNIVDSITLSTGEKNLFQ